MAAEQQHGERAAAESEAEQQGVFDDLAAFDNWYYDQIDVRTKRWWWDFKEAEITEDRGLKFKATVAFWDDPQTVLYNRIWEDKPSSDPVKQAYLRQVQLDKAKCSDEQTIEYARNFGKKNGRGGERSDSERAAKLKELENNRPKDFDSCSVSREKKDEAFMAEFMGMLQTTLGSTDEEIATIKEDLVEGGGVRSAGDDAEATAPRSMVAVTMVPGDGGQWCSSTEAEAAEKDDENDVGGEQVLRDNAEVNEEARSYQQKAAKRAAKKADKKAAKSAKAAPATKGASASSASASSASDEQKRMYRRMFGNDTGNKKAPAEAKAAPGSSAGEDARDALVRRTTEELQKQLGPSVNDVQVVRLDNKPLPEAIWHDPRAINDWLKARGDLDPAPGGSADSAAAAESERTRVYQLAYDCFK